jgi:hypothetical protein
MCGVLTWGSPLLKIFNFDFLFISLAPVSGACPRSFFYFFIKFIFSLWCLTLMVSYRIPCSSARRSTSLYGVAGAAVIRRFL